MLEKSAVEQLLPRRLKLDRVSQLQENLTNIARTITGTQPIDSTLLTAAGSADDAAAPCLARQRDSWATGQFD
jgi:hypothetical protein